MRNMKYLPILLFVFSACGVETPPEPEVEYTAVQTNDGPLAREETELVKLVATVANVNKKNREITLKDPNGELVKFDVGPQVKRLDEIVMGDKVVIEYYESFAYEVRPPTEAELANPTTSVALAGKANKMLPPGMAAGKMTSTIVKVMGIDTTQNTVTIETPAGKLLTIKARVPQNLSRIKVGDTVAVQYTRAMAVALEPVGERLY